MTPSHPTSIYHFLLENHKHTHPLLFFVLFVCDLAMSSAKKARGRQKIEMKKMSNLQVTFSKRRSGIFKKASELCTLCGADAALVVFSPSGKVFSFGHPNLDTVIDRYLSLVPPQNNDTMQFIEAHRNANVRELNAQLTQINNTLDAEKKIGDELRNFAQ